ncbi:ORFL184C.iORF2 [Human betaherpesvirus 5]|nr:ORFL184C.iORF2 [Human betaherpesvirus 5]QHX40527.1 ORFL184C.iORF2 [Human betaherpesvirus 5]
MDTICFSAPLRPVCTRAFTSWTNYVTLKSH